MKKNMIFAIAIIFLLVANGCTKDEIADTSSKNKIESKVSLQPIKTNIEADAKLMEKMMKLKKQMAEVKSGKSIIEDMDITDAEQLLEALVNYDFTSMIQAFPEYRTETITSLIPTSGGEISVEDIQAVYEQVDQAVLDILNSGNTVEINSIQLIPGTISGNMVPVSFILNVGFYPNDVVFTASNDDNWYWGKKLGKLNGQHVGVYDATDALTTASNQILIDFYQLNDYYFDNTEMKVFTQENSNLPSSQNGNYNFRIWFQDYTQVSLGEPYLNPQDMNYYMNEVLYLAQLNKPANKAIINIVVGYNWDDQIYNPGQINMKKRWHKLHVNYGVQHLK